MYISLIRINIFISTLSLIFLVFEANAQRFGSSVVGGMNLSQMDGDNLQGFDKPGIHGGLRTTYRWKSSSGISLELLYQQKGSSSSLVSGSPSSRETITLHYLSIPVQYFLSEWKEDDADYYRFRLEAGLMISYLVDVSSTNSFFDNAVNDFRDTDAGICGSLSYRFSQRLAFTGRFERSFLKIYEDPLSNIRGLQSYLLTFRLEISL